MEASTVKNNKLFLEADQMIAGGRMAEAMEILLEILNDDPAFARAHNHLGWIYDTQLCDQQSAEDHYKHAINFDPEYSSPYFNYYEVLFAQKRYKEAEAILTKAHERPRINKDRIYYMQGRLNEAQSKYHEAEYYFALYGKGCFDNKSMETAEDSINRCAKKVELFDPILKNED